MSDYIENKIHSVVDNMTEEFSKIFNSFIELKIREERNRIEFNSISLYEKTGDIKDFNTLIIQRNVLYGKMEPK